MYRGFNLLINGKNVSWATPSYYERGKRIYLSNKDHIKTQIETFILGDGSINGSKMEADWFPLIHADVFISHSHADGEQAICLAGYLHEVFDLRCFVDSCVWGNADILLRAIDNAKCKNRTTGNYDYKKRNSSTSHVHMMLTAALLKMIHKTECLFFLKTPNSVTSTTDKIISQTESPWIYAEILISFLIEKRTLAQHRPKLMKAKSFSEVGALNESIFRIRHDIFTGHLQDINEALLAKWENLYGYSIYEEYPLDGLYQLF